MKVVSLSFYRHPASAYESERAGAGRGVFFINYMRSWIRAHHAVFPDYQLRIHHDRRVTEYPYWKAVEKFEANGLVTLVPMGEADYLCSAMVWRLRPIWDPAVTHVLCRDVDSMPTPRERKAVERWIESGKAIHSMHDSISHCGLMGGTISFNCAKVRPTMPRPPEIMETHGDDQRWLNAVIAPQFADSIVTDNTQSMGPREHPIDMLCNGVGLAFHVDPLVKWFSENRSHCPRLDEIEECEAL